MMKTLVGIVSFGLTNFTQLTIESIRATTKNKVEFYVIVGKPGDTETVEFLQRQAEKYGDIQCKIHTENMGFPYSVNDIYDYAWKYGHYDNLILAGNDVIVYPYAVDSLINLANKSNYEVISSLQYDVKSLINEFPETQQYFYGGNYIFNDFSAKPWELFKSYYPEPSIADMQLYDIQNLCLYKKSVFQKIGYTDVNFYPAYYIDNDYARRIVNSGIKCCSMTNARFFHFWSRTIKQGTGGSTSKNFENNRAYYMQKWNGDFGQEQIQAPVLIDSREGEEEIIRKWKAA